MTRATNIQVPKTELFYYDVETGTSKPVADDNGVIRVAVVGGGTGGSSMGFLGGTEVPTADIGSEGDVYLNTTNGDLYKKQNGVWGVLINLMGPQGPQGERGLRGYKGEKGDKGDIGPAGFGTEAQYTDIIQRLEALESNYLRTTSPEIQKF